MSIYLGVSCAVALHQRLSGYQREDREVLRGQATDSARPLTSAAEEWRREASGVGLGVGLKTTVDQPSSLKGPLKGSLDGDRMEDGRKQGWARAGPRDRARRDWPGIRAVALDLPQREPRLATVRTVRTIRLRGERGNLPTTTTTADNIHPKGVS